MLDDVSPRSSSIYQKPTGLGMIRLGVDKKPIRSWTRSWEELIKNAGYSPDNGRTWQAMKVSPRFDNDLPRGYRRVPFTPWLDPINGNIMVLLSCMDTPGKDPNAHEPNWQWYHYYLRCRVSTDGGRTYLFDEPIVQQGKEYSPKHPIEGVYTGKNCYMLGDRGCRPIRTRKGTVLVPIQRWPLNPNGKGLYKPSSAGWYWLESMILIGRWTEDNHIVWDASEPIKGDADRTSQGLYEPTLAELPDGKILCVMRGSNGGPRDQSFQWPSHKWVSVSEDGGYTWSEPKPWAYSDGKPFFSPASMSQLFTHSNGRIYWIGNLSERNCRGMHPRWPLVTGEVDPKTHGLIRESVLVIDRKQPDEEGVNLSHWHSFEDRETRDIVIPMARASKDYKSIHPVTYVIGVKQ